MTQSSPEPVATRVQVTDELAVHVELSEGRLHVLFASRPGAARRAGHDPQHASWSAHTPIDHRGLTETLRSLLADPPEGWLALLADRSTWDQRRPAVVEEIVESLQAEIDRQVQAILRDETPWE